LLYHFALRELKVKYKSPILGFLWMFFLPLSMAFIFKIVFSQIVKIQTPGYPFSIFLILGIFPWNYLAMSLSGTVNSLVDNEALIKKVYFPREIIPLSIILGNLVNFLISNFVILMFMFLMKIKLSKLLPLLPFLILLQTIFITGLALIFSALQVHYRDVKYIVEVLLIFWFYISPIFYPLRLVRDVSESFLRVYLWNPLAHMITLYRLVYLKGYWKVLPEGFSIPFSIIYSLGISLLVFILGFLTFRRLQRFFTDYL